ncbi:hypothetical protein CANINC_001489 [Pichia inconspicua]|uniref:PRELI/MSF1 domain-containing protein n=1 Tax=Pichia inconspicua TaxID=52247 RepID=A0A4T0X3P3_9ASCO|nr:hypothetical protein CANINC_001489 [[Candida] inconspicua]
MVLHYQSKHTYNHTFETVTLAYFNRYPNPYSAHVKSTDTLEVYIDELGRLHQIKLIKKSGRLPNFVKPFLGKITTSWIIENTIVDPKSKEMITYNCNLDHRKIIRVEEFNTYKYDFEKNVTNSLVTVLFSSGFTQRFGLGLNIKDRIENWSRKKFSDNLLRSREGLNIVMENVRERLSTAKQNAASKHYIS